MELDDVRAVLQYYISISWLGHSLEEHQYEELYMQSQGNWYNLHQQAKNYIRIYD